MCCSSLNVFMVNNTPSESAVKVARRPKCFSFFFVFFFRWARSKLHDSFTMVFTQKQQHFTLSSAPAHRFFTSLMRHFKPVGEELWLHF